jgi:hypothetical protein
MTRESVPANTKGTAEFQIIENNPLLTGPGALTMEINQVGQGGCSFTCTD